jgi:short-subunit dehydrogenase
MHTLITGASSGIGHALARRLVERGHAVWGVARREAALEALRVEVGERFRFTAVDLTDPGAGRAVAASMSESKFLPDAVVLNAAISPHDCEQVYDDSLSRPVLETNYHGALSFVGELLEPFLARGSGQFLAVSSVFAERPDPLAINYAASKAALTMAFRSLSIRYRATPVRFKSMLLGPISTEPDAAGARRRPLSFHLRTAPQAAAAIDRALAGHREIDYFPWLVGMAMRATRWMPDAVFQRVTGPFRRFPVQWPPQSR